MVQKKSTTNLTELLLECVTKADPMLSMLEWLCDQLMEAEISAKIGADKSKHSTERSSYRSGYRPRRFDTRMGTIYLMVPKIRQGGYVPFFVGNRKRSEAALIQVVQEAYVNGVSTRKMERLAKSLGIDNLSRSQVSNMAKELDEQVDAFRNRPLDSNRYPVLWVDALYEKVRYGGRVISMAIQVVCGVNAQGMREILAIEPMLEESRESYTQLFDKLKKRGLQTPSLIISDANGGLVAAIQKNFPGASWQRCKVHFMRNILAKIPHRNKESFAAELKQVWLAPNAKSARKRADSLTEEYEKRFPDAIQIFEDGLEDSLQFYSFPALDSRKISSSNMLERLNKEIRRRTRVIGIFPNPDSYVRLIATYLVEYAEDWTDSKAYFSAESMQNAFPTAA